MERERLLNKDGQEGLVSDRTKTLYFGTGETLTLSFDDGEGAKDLTYDLLGHRLNSLNIIFCSMILQCYFRKFHGLSKAAGW